MKSKYLGAEIKRRRKELRLTQAEVAKGICDQGEISRIENGKFLPTMDILLALSTKLEIPVSYWFEAAISDKISDIESIKNSINYYLNHHKYHEIIQICEKELKNNELFGEHKQFLMWAKTISCFYTKKISMEECIYQLEKCLSERIYYINIIQKMYIRNSIANVYASSGKNRLAINEYEKFFSIFEYNTNPYFYLQVLFNYTNTLHNEKQYIKTISIIDTGIILCKKADKFSLLGKFYFLKGECLIDLKSPNEEIQDCFQKSLFIFNELERNDYIQLLYNNYYKYIEV